MRSFELRDELAIFFTEHHFYLKDWEANVAFRPGHLGDILLEKGQSEPETYKQKLSVFLASDKI